MGTKGALCLGMDREEQRSSYTVCGDAANLFAGLTERLNCAENERKADDT